MENSTLEEKREKNTFFFSRIQQENKNSNIVLKPVCDEYIAEYKKHIKCRRKQYENYDSEVSLAEQYIY